MFQGALSIMTKFIVLGALLLTTFLVFRPCLEHDFLYWDDDAHAWNNPAIKRLSPDHIRQMFTSTVNQTYIPLTTFTFALEYAVSGERPFLYHLDNILLHLGVVALVFLFALSLGLPGAGAACGALLFAIHPLHVESVAWVTARKDTLYALFYVLALEQYVQYLRTKKRSHYLISVGSCALSMLAKPMALSLPLILFLLDWFLEQKLSPKTILEKIPYFLIVVPLGWITYSLHARMPIRDMGESCLIWIWTFIFYINKFLWPQALAPLYSLPEPVAITNPAFLVPLAFFILMLGVLYHFRRQRWLILAFAFYVLSIFFILRLDHSMDTEIVADRYMYLPSLGFCLFIGYGFGYLLNKKPAFSWLALPFFLYLGAMSYNQSKVWKNDLTLWHTALAVNPQTPIAYNNIGNYFYKKNDLDAALANYSQAIALAPRFHLPYSNRGAIYCARRQYDLALADFTISLHLKPSSSGYNNRGSIYLMTGKLDQALEDFDKSLVLNPANNVSHYNRGEVFRVSGRHQPAIAAYSRAIDLDPQDTDSYLRRAAMYEVLKAYPQALADYQKVHRLAPQDPRATDGMQRLKK